MGHPDRCSGWDPVKNLRCSLPEGHAGNHDGEGHLQLPAAKHDHPAHYGGKDNVYETYKVFEAWFADGRLHTIVGAYVFNTIKYLSRAGKKSGETLLDDLKKARWYLDEAITWLEGRES